MSDRKGQNGTLLRQYGGYALALGLCVALVVAANWLFNRPDPAEDYLSKKAIDKSEVLGLFQTKAQLATTEVKLRRLGIYDSNTQMATMNPANWRLGRRSCILPVDITIKYGIDLTKMQEADVKMSDSTTVVHIRLPKAELIDYAMDQRVSRTEVVTMSGGFRSSVGEQTLQTIRNKVLNEVLADTTLFRQLENQINSNTRTVFAAMLRQMGLQPMFVN